MSALIGSSGFVGGHIQNNFKFDQKYNRTNIDEIKGLRTNLLVCAGLPAEKWKANSDPQADWSNMSNLAQNLSTTEAETAVLISTIDVFQPAQNVTEKDFPALNGRDAYGRNRAWFETFFSSHFSNSLIIRLPGLIGAGLRKNFIYDLLNGRLDQVEKVNSNSMFQYFDITQTWNLVQQAQMNNISILNIATEPISAQEIANPFGIELNVNQPLIEYDMKSIYADVFHGSNGYLKGKEEILASIVKLLR